MTKDEIQKHLISDSDTLRTALQTLNALPGGKMTVFAVDIRGRVAGSVTDGDIRRALLAGSELDTPVHTVMNTSFRRLDYDMTPHAMLEALSRFHRSGITLVPRTDTEGILTDIVDLSVTRSLLPLSAILMAGGKGERLRPLTLTTPKPLLKVDGKCIIDYNVEALAAVGIDNITVCTRYLAEQIYDHFSRPVAGVQVKCVTESIPMGTIGAASLVDIPDDGDTLVMNSDLLTSIAFDSMYMHHLHEHADITVAVIPYQVTVPFAILATDGPAVTDIAEKPSYSYFANAGIYIVSNTLLRTLPADTRTDATDLVSQAIADGRRVTYFVINGTWIDVGSPTDFEHATRLMQHHRALSQN